VRHCRSKDRTAGEVSPGLSAALLAEIAFEPLMRITSPVMTTSVMTGPAAARPWLRSAA
jgi:hypothetical protein